MTEPRFLSKAISIALNKRLLTVGRGVIHHTDLYFLWCILFLASGPVLEQTGLLGNGSHREGEAATLLYPLPHQAPNKLQRHRLIQTQVPLDPRPPRPPLMGQTQRHSAVQGSWSLSPGATGRNS